MIKAILRLARAFTGLWSEIRRIRLLLEWIMVNGLTGTIDTARFVINPVHLPPTAAEIAAAEKETVEHQEYDEEAEAGRRAIEILKKRAKGENIDEDDPGADFDIF